MNRKRNGEAEVQRYYGIGEWKSIVNYGFGMSGLFPNNFKFVHYLSRQPLPESSFLKSANSIQVEVKGHEMPCTLTAVLDHRCQIAEAEGRKFGVRRSCFFVWFQTISTWIEAGGYFRRSVVDFRRSMSMSSYKRREFLQSFNTIDHHLIFQS